MPITLARESISDVKSDVAALAPAHQEEAASNYIDPDEVDIDLDSYSVLEPLGHVRVYTARDDGKLVGYCGFMLSMRTLQTGRRIKWAVQDAIYVMPAYRGPMVLRFLYYQDLSLEFDGARKILRHASLPTGFHKILLHMNYRLVERGYVRDVGRVA